MGEQALVRVMCPLSCDRRARPTPVASQGFLRTVRSMPTALAVDRSIGALEQYQTRVEWQLLLAR